MSTYIPMRVKQLIYPKAHGKNKKSIDSSSKSTRAASKNILALENKKLMDKVNYTDLYSDLISSRQNLEKCVKKYPKDEDDETSANSNFSNDKFYFKKNKKIYSPKRAKINFVKYYKEDGMTVDFPIYKERELNIDIYDKKVDIESGEDDFLSDEGTINYGLDKVKKDLIATFEIIKKENYHCIENLKKYSKFIDKDKRINLKKKLPIHK